jgi:hypothetical protein
MFSEQQSGDDESGKNEEDVDTDEPASQPRHACMEEHDQQNGDGAQTFHIGSELAIARSCASFIAGFEKSAPLLRRRLEWLDTRPGLRASIERQR